VYQWVESFQSGRTSIVDEDHLGHPTTSQTVDNVEQVNALVQEDRQITVTHTADELEISCGSAYSIVHEDLGYHKICASWVPKQLTDEQKQACVEMYMQFFN
jgi:hypothetical protein